MPPTPSPTYQRLRDTIAKRMRMSHVYQPLMLMELLGYGSARQQPAPHLRAGRGPPDPGGGRDPDRGLHHRTPHAPGGQGSASTASPAANSAPTAWWAA
jgi:hypothetical protein